MWTLFGTAIALNRHGFSNSTNQESRTKSVQHYNCAITMKTNVTLKIEADLLQEARILAAEEHTSVSAMLAARLEEAVRVRRGYQQARRSALTRLRKGYDLHWTPPRSRDEVHER